MTRRLPPALVVLAASACAAPQPDHAPVVGDFAFLTIRLREEAAQEAAAALEHLLQSRYGSSARVDVETGIARARVRHPMTLEPVHLAGEVEAMGFAVKGIEIQAAATVEGRIVTLHPTGQKFPLQGREPTNPGPGWGTFAVRGWDDPSRTTFEVLPWDDGWIPAGGGRR